LFIKDLTS